jgi:hypothetical protein
MFTAAVIAMVLSPQRVLDGPARWLTDLSDDADEVWEPFMLDDTPDA